MGLPCFAFFLLIDVFLISNKCTALPFWVRPNYVDEEEFSYFLIVRRGIERPMEGAAGDRDNKDRRDFAVRLKGAQNVEEHQ